MINKFVVSTGGLFVALLWSNSSFAACSLNDSNFVAQNVIMDMGDIVLDPSTPLGAIIADRSFAITPKPNSGSCGRGGGAAIGELINGSLVTAPGVGSNVYSTNIQGIGVRLYRDSGDIEHYYPHRLELPSGSLSLVAGVFRVEIIKTNQYVGSGPLVSGLYSTYYLDGDTRAKPSLTSELRANGIVIRTPTCSYRDGTDNQTVELEDVGAREFNGVGATAKPKEFSIKFNCTGGTVYDHKLNLNLSYTAANNDQGVIKNTVGNDYATGVGVQVMTTGTTSQPVKSNTPVFVGNIPKNSNLSPEIKLKAQYYQTEASINPGKVFATAILDIVYN